MTGDTMVATAAATSFSASASIESPMALAVLAPLVLLASSAVTLSAASEGEMSTPPAAVITSLSVCA